MQGNSPVVTQHNTRPCVQTNYLRLMTWRIIIETSDLHLHRHISILGAFAKLRISSCPSLRVEQLDSHWTDFDEIWYLSLFRKSVLKIQVSLKSDKNNGCFTWRRFHIYDNISLNYSYIFTYLVFNNFFFPKIVPFYQLMSKNMVEPGSPQMKIWRMRFV